MKLKNSAKPYLTAITIKEQLIKTEIERSGESFKKIAQNYGEKIDTARSVCHHQFDEQILLFGKK